MAWVRVAWVLGVWFLAGCASGRATRTAAPPPPAASPATTPEAKAPSGAEDEAFRPGADPGDAAQEAREEPRPLGPLENPDAQRADDLYAARMLQQPQDIRAVMARAVLRQRAGDRLGAVLLYRRALQLEPDFGPAYANLGALLLEMDRTEDALPVLLEGVARAPDHAPLFGNLAGALARQKRFDEAVSAAQTAIEIDNKDVDLRRNLAAIHFRAGQPEEAERVLKGALAEFPDEAPDLLSRLAELHQAQGDTDRALEMLARVNALAPRAPLPWLKRAAILGRKDDLDGCIAVLLEAMDHNPQDTEIRGFFMAAMATRLQRDLETGMDRLNKDSSDVEAYLLVARVHEVRRDLPSALDVLQDGVNNNPGNSDLWGQLGLVQSNLDQEADALQSYRKAIALDGKAGVSLNNCAYLLVTARDTALHDRDEALGLALRAVALEPTNTAFLDTLAEVQLVRGDVRAAQDLIDKALLLNPADPYLLAQAERMALVARTGRAVPPPQVSGPRRGRR